MSMSAAHREALARFLAEISDGTDFPALSAFIDQVMQKADEDVSIQHMTNVILKDFSLTLKVLRTANSAYYNRSGRPILSVSHAVAMLGIDAVRDLAGSMVLFEHFQRKSSGLRELILLSLLTANHARELADRLHFPNREEAYLCGMFRNLGEVLVACYRPREYAEILVEMSREKLTIPHACRKVLGFTYEEAGRAVVDRWHMPESVGACMLESDLRLGRLGALGEILEAVAQFAHKLTHAIYRREPQAARASVNLLIESQGALLGIGRDEVRDTADAALKETKDTFGLMRVPLDDLRLQRQTEAALSTLGEEATAQLADPAVSPKELLARLRHEIDTVLDSRSPFEIDSVIFMVMEAIYRGGPFDRVLFSLVDVDRNILHAKAGLGENIDAAIERFSFPIAREAGPVGAAVLRRTDVYSVTSRDRRYTSSALVRKMAPGAFGLFPLVVDGLVIGCLYFDRARAGAPVDPATLASIGGLRSRLAEAVDRRRLESRMIGGCEMVPSS